MRKKKLSKSAWYAIYADLMLCWYPDTACFSMLCDKKSDFAAVEAELHAEIHFSGLGRKMFGSLSSYIAGAKLGVLVGELFCKWEASPEVEITLDAVAAGIQTIADQVVSFL